MFLIWLVMLSSASVIACAESAPTRPSPVPSFSTHATTGFTFRYTALDASTVESTAGVLERESARIAADLGVQQMPPVTVTLHPSRESLRAAAEPLIGQVPAFAQGLVTGPGAIHVVSPNLAAEWTYEAGLTAIVHEFAHCVTLRVNPGLPSNARWLWESVALFEARQMVNPRTVPSLARGEPPPLRQLNAIDDRTVYDVGGVLGAFIVDTWGRDTLIALIRADGNLLQVPGITEPEFLGRWMTYLRERFSI